MIPPLPPVVATYPGATALLRPGQWVTLQAQGAQVLLTGAGARLTLPGWPAGVVTPADGVVLTAKVLALTPVLRLQTVPLPSTAKVADIVADGLEPAAWRSEQAQLWRIARTPPDPPRAVVVEPEAYWPFGPAQQGEVRRGALAVARAEEAPGKLWLIARSKRGGRVRLVLRLYGRRVDLWLEAGVDEYPALLPDLAPLAPALAQCGWQLANPGWRVVDGVPPRGWGAAGCPQPAALEVMRLVLRTTGWRRA